jgi:hypothetical protein
MCNEILGN